MSFMCFYETIIPVLTGLNFRCCLLCFSSSVLFCEQMSCSSALPWTKFITLPRNDDSLIRMSQKVFAALLLYTLDSKKVFVHKGIASYIEFHLKCRISYYI